jgi:hypothetical protein
MAYTASQRRRDFDTIDKLLSSAPAIDKSLRIGPDEFHRRHKELISLLNKDAIDVGIVFSDEHYNGDVPYLGGNTNITVEQVAGVIGKTGFHLLAGLEGGYVAEQLSPRSGSVINVQVTLKEIIKIDVKEI